MFRRFAAAQHCIELDIAFREERPLFSDQGFTEASKSAQLFQVLLSEIGLQIEAMHNNVEPRITLESNDRIVELREFGSFRVLFKKECKR